MRRTVPVAAIVVSLLLALPSLAVEVEDRRAGVIFDVPSWWNGEQREEGYVFATKDETLVVMLWTPKGKTLRDAVNELDRELAKVIRNIRTDGEPQSGRLNGMETISVSGRGKIDRASVEWSVVIIDAKRPLFLLAFGERGKWERHSDALAGFIQTIRRKR